MVGIIVAMQEELEAIEKHMNRIKVQEKYDTDFIVGKIGKTDCVVVISGVGKVNSARTTQLLIDNYHPEYIINVGVAGGISDRVKIGDIVIGQKLVQYDFDLTAFGREKGEVSDKVGKFICSDKDLLTRVKKVFPKDSQNKVICGIISTGDRFITQSRVSKGINEQFGADCVEMEGASIAQVCFLDKIPFVVIRSISDSPNDKGKIDYESFLRSASEKVAEFLHQFLNS